MPRSMWKGAISFGLVTIPVSVYPATEEKTLRFNQLHDEDGGRIRMKRTCSRRRRRGQLRAHRQGLRVREGQVRGPHGGRLRQGASSSRAIDIVQFVDLEDIDPIMYKKTYYLIPRRPVPRPTRCSAKP